MDAFNTSGYDHQNRHRPAGGILMAGWVRRAASGRYQARYRTPGGPTRSKTFDRRKDAEKWLRRELAPIDRGDWIDPAAGTLTVANVPTGP